MMRRLEDGKNDVDGIEARLPRRRAVDSFVVLAQYGIGIDVLPGT